MPESDPVMVNLQAAAELACAHMEAQKELNAQLKQVRADLKKSQNAVVQLLEEANVEQINVNGRTLKLTIESKLSVE